MTRPRIPRWALVASLAGVLLALSLTFAADARAQGLDRLDAHTPPDLSQAASDDGGMLGWLEDNKGLLLACFGILGALLVLYWIVSQGGKTKRLQRDALEKLRKSILESCKATRGRPKRVWIMGSPRDPPTLLGRYAGHHSSVDVTWIAYRTWLLGGRRMLCTNSVDIVSLQSAELQVRAIGVNVTRGIGYAVPDVSDEEQRLDWQQATRGRPIRTAEEFSAAWKAYYAHAVDNAIAFYDAMNATEDRSFLRQEVTRSPDELTDTLIAPTKPTPQQQEAETDA